MSKKNFLFAFLLFLAAQFCYSNDAQFSRNDFFQKKQSILLKKKQLHMPKPNVLSTQGRQLLEAKGVKIAGPVPKLVTLEKDSLDEDHGLLRIAVSVNLNQSGIEPVYETAPIYKSLLSLTTNIDTVMTDGFERDSPSTKWQRTGNPTWGRTNYQKNFGDYSAWCAKDSSDGAEPGQGYPNNCHSMMIYGPFDLSGINHAELHFWHWLDTEYEKDWFFCGASIDGVNFSGIDLTGATGFWSPVWREETLNLSNIPGLGSICGNPKVYVAFSFMSDNNSSDDIGVFIDDISLTKRNVPGTPIVGAISGRLNKSKNPYIVIQDVGVAEGDSLIIEPGVKVCFDGDYEFIVQGVLSAVGSKQDSIIFTSNKLVPNEGDWKAVALFESGILHISHSVITYAGGRPGDYTPIGGIYCDAGKAVITNNRISYNRYGIFCSGGSINIENNLIANNKEDGIYCRNSPTIAANVIRKNGVGIFASYSSPIIDGNVIEENQGPGINGPNSSPIVVHNRILGNGTGISLQWGSFPMYPGRDYTVISNNHIINNLYDGISISFINGAASIANNVISGNTGSGITCEELGTTGNEIGIVNNTIANNSKCGIELGSLSGDLNILNNIVYKNEMAGIKTHKLLTLSTVNNDMFGNKPDFDLFILDSLGILTRRNANGDSCDAYLNITLDPLFMYPDSNSYILQNESPCINAGNPFILFNDKDSSINDMGAMGGSSIFTSFIDFTFDSVEVGLNARKELLIFNARQSELTISKTFLSDVTNYSVSNEIPLSIPSFGMSRITIVFNPQTAGNFSCALELHSNGFVGASSAAIRLLGSAYWAGTVVSGEAKGVWRRHQSPYLINSDITINDEDTLSIEPGVRVLFKGYYKILVYGTLLAIGTAQDSISFDMHNYNEQDGWWGINFWRSKPISRIEYCKIQHVHGGWGAIWCTGTSPIISHNTIAKNKSNREGIAINCSNDSSPTITNNIIRNNGANGYSGGGGIACLNSSPFIANNIIIENEATCGGIYSVSSHAMIVNNVICNNLAWWKGGGIYLESDSSTLIMNNILRGNKQGYSLNEIGFSDDAIVNLSYCNIQGGWQGDGNIDIDPKFVNADKYDLHLQPSSPCIDSGSDSVIFNDPENPNKSGYALFPALGTARNDIGAYGGPGAANWNIVTAVESKPEVPANLPKDYELSQNYPNPFNLSTNIKYDLPKSTDVSIKIYNTLGQLIKTLVEEEQPTGSYTIQWKGTNDYGHAVISGIYFYKIRTNDFIKNRKMILIQ